MKLYYSSVVNAHVQRVGAIGNNRPILNMENKIKDVCVVYVMEVRHEGFLIYKLTTAELSEIVHDLIEYCNDSFSQYEIRIFEIPRMSVGVSDE